MKNHFKKTANKNMRVSNNNEIVKYSTVYASFEIINMQ